MIQHMLVLRGTFKGGLLHILPTWCLGAVTAILLWLTLEISSAFFGAYLLCGLATMVCHLSIRKEPRH